MEFPDAGDYQAKQMNDTERAGSRDDIEREEFHVVHVKMDSSDDPRRVTTHLPDSLHAQREMTSLDVATEWLRGLP